jgi:hypothetical protein
MAEERPIPGCIGRDDNAAGRRLSAGKWCEDF